MQSEIIHIPNAFVVPIEKNFNGFFLDLAGSNIKYPKNVEEIGIPFNVQTKKKLKGLFRESEEYLSLRKESLEYYLEKAKVEFTLEEIETERKYDPPNQYIGVIAGNPTNLEMNLKLGESEKNIEKSIIPCQFYLIKDKL